MDQVSGIGVAQPRAVQAVWEPPDRRRVLQLTLAALWFLDAVLQLQPFMFSRSFGLLMLGPTALGNPAAIGHPITDVSRSIGQHSVGADTAFIVVQFLIAFGIAYRPTVRLALAGSVAWALAVWWLGEGLGGVLTGTANPLTGAPGAVILYAVLALLLWPTTARSDAPFIAARPLGIRTAQGIWLVIWASLGVMELFESSTRDASRVLSRLAIGEPGWLGDVDRHAATLLAGRGSAVAVIVGILFVVTALGVFLPPRWATVVIAVAIALAAVLWVVGEDFGQIFTGAATDPNSGPLLVLLALAYWPIRGRSSPSMSRAPAL